jgi:hypothetical protein
MVSERPQGPVRPDAGRAHAALEDPGDLREGELLEPREEEHLPVVPVEAAERPAVQERVVVAGGRGLVGALRDSSACSERPDGSTAIGADEDFRKWSEAQRRAEVVHPCREACPRRGRCGGT